MSSLELEGILEHVRLVFQYVCAYCLKVNMSCLCTMDSLMSRKEFAVSENICGWVFAI